jgi:hypothetical protein
MTFSALLATVETDLVSLIVKQDNKNRILLEKLIVAQLVSKSPPLCNLKVYYHVHSNALSASCSDPYQSNPHPETLFSFLYPTIHA